MTRVRTVAAAAGAAAVALVVPVAGCSSAGAVHSGVGAGAGRRPPAAAPAVATTGPEPGTAAAPPVPSVLSFAGPVPAGVATGLGPWVMAGRDSVLGPWSDQGLATIRAPGARATLAYRGTLAVDARLRRQGWDHVGDPDSWDGWLVEPFQGGPGSTAKMFRVTAPTGSPVTEHVHHLAPGEAANNSFAAVTPDGRWTVTAEWGYETRLLVLPGPEAMAALPPGADVPLAGTVALDRPVRDLQGCAFSGAATLVCDTSDPYRDLWPEPDQVLALDLSAAAPGGPPARAAVGYLGQVPAAGPCPGAYEPEGVDVDRAVGVLRIEVVPPAGCAAVTQVYRYRLREVPSGPGR